MEFYLDIPITVDKFLDPILRKNWAAGTWRTETQLFLSTSHKKCSLGRISYYAERTISLNS
jgi:hypothetical protein